MLKHSQQIIVSIGSYTTEAQSYVSAKASRQHNAQCRPNPDNTAEGEYIRRKKV
jgi:hypothetical protein